MSSRTMTPRQVAAIDEARCIGCTLCIEACPFDAILGAANQMHTVLTALCTGCDLCVAPCPVDCIAMVQATGADAAWDRVRALAAKGRAKARKLRLAREESERQAQLSEKSEGRPAHDKPRRRAAIEAAIQRARARRAAAKGTTGGSRGGLP